MEHVIMVEQDKGELEIICPTLKEAQTGAMAKAEETGKVCRVYAYDNTVDPEKDFQYEFIVAYVYVDGYLYTRGQG